MTRSSRTVVLLLVLVAVVVVAYLATRAGQAAEAGPPVAFCPGPDQYGYTCQANAAYAYIDATQDTGLYEDDGVVALDLPFPFVFYGRTYTTVNAVSNGNLQFGGDNAAFENVCLAEGPALEMGDMLAPYWDDLDLTFTGYLETAVAGAAPERVFVVEWDDVPRFGGDETVTFEVQLFEGSNDIVFLYRSVNTAEGNNGRSATIGLQSESQGLALQFSCDQAMINNGATVYFDHPDEAGAAAAIPPAVPRAAAQAAKGDVALVIETLTLRGRAALPDLNRGWLSQTPARSADWQWVDLTGDGREDLLLLWRGPGDRPWLSQLALLAAGPAGRWSLLVDQRLTTRQALFARPALGAVVDLTGDDRPDILLRDEATGQLLVAADIIGAGGWQLYPVPERCLGGLRTVDIDQGGPRQIVRDGCSGARRLVTVWDGRQFVNR